MRNPFASENSVGVLMEALARADRELARLTARRLQILARLDELANGGGENGRVVAGMVAGASKCSAQQAEGELALARKLKVLPAVSEALEKGDVSVAQVGLVAQVAEAGDEDRALELAALGDNRQLEREAQAKRRDVADVHRKARDRRFVSFKDDPDGASMSMLAKGPWADVAGLKALLEKYARQLQRGAGAAKEPFSARMFDALMLVTGQSTTAVVNAAMAEQAADGGVRGSNSKPTTMGVTDVARVFTKVRNGSAGGSVAVAEDDRVGDRVEDRVEADAGSLFFHGAGADPHGVDLDAEPFPDRTNDEFESIFDELFPDELFPDIANDSLVSVEPSHRSPIVTRADTKLIVHWDASTGIVNYENGPPIAHARLEALLCDAVLEVVHYSNGSPNGIVTYQRTVNDRQANYLAQRDGRCRTPGCPGIGHTHAHHIDRWPVTHVTPTNRMLNVCNYCHSCEHDGRLAIVGDPEGTLTFRFADGRVLHSTARVRPSPKSASSSRADDPG